MSFYVDSRHNWKISELNLAFIVVPLGLWLISIKMDITLCTYMQIVNWPTLPFQYPLLRKKYPQCWNHCNFWIGSFLPFYLALQFTLFKMQSPYTSWREVVCLNHFNQLQSYQLLSFAGTVIIHTSTMYTITLFTIISTFSKWMNLPT